MESSGNDFQFSLSMFQMRLQAIDEVELPQYLGSTLRGGFGLAFRRVVCAVRETDCQNCMLRDKCVYAYVFETPRPDNARMMRLYRTVPHPFVLEPPGAGQENRAAPGDILEMGLVAIGRAIEYLPYFVYSVQQMAKTGLGKGRGRFQLVSVEQKTPVQGRPKSLYSSGGEKLEKQEPPLTWEHISRKADSTGPVNEIALNLATPTRMKFGEMFVADLEFHHLIRNLLRRLSSLSYFHCGGNGQVDFRGLIDRSTRVKVKQQALEWYDWQRYSSRQGGKMKMGGLVGRIAFEGDLNEFLPFLLMGELVHVGKGTSFGLGKYEILNW